MKKNRSVGISNNINRQRSAEIIFPRAVLNDEFPADGIAVVKTKVLFVKSNFI